MTEVLPWSARLLGFHLGLGDLSPSKPCHGYANVCTCPECSERAERARKAPEIVRQPWDVRVA